MYNTIWLTINVVSDQKECVCAYSYFLSLQHSAYLTEDSGISEGSSENNEREEALFTKLKALAQDLESKLTPQSSIVQEIAQVRKG